MNAIRLLILLGFFFFVVLGFISLIPFIGAVIPGFIPLLGLIMIVVGVILGFRPGGILRKERAIEEWSVLIDEACMANGHDKADTLYKDITTFLKASEAPNLRVETQDLAPSLTRSIFGDQRRFLVLTDVTNRRIKPYQIYISTRPYGINLACDWYMTYKPSWLMALLSVIPYVNFIPQTISDIDLFDQQGLRAYATNAHHCMLKAVTELMEYLNAVILLCLFIRPVYWASPTVRIPN
jgi:hypothetical protein